MGTASMQMRLLCRVISMAVLFWASGASNVFAGPLLHTQDQSLLDEHVYIVQFSQPPALTYRGRPDGLAATRPGKEQKFDPRSVEVRQYTQTLLDKHDHALRSIGAYENKLYSYRYTFNGFAARLTALQAQKLRSRKDVLNVWEDRVRYLYTNDSPVYLGLYDATAGLASALNLKGEDVVIGVIDSGIAPEHPSFADSIEAKQPRLCKSAWAESSVLGLWLCQRFKKRDDRLVYEQPIGWNGSCEAGENFTVDSCNNKIIGARYYADGFREIYAMDENEFMSPRDADGHGTHIASTAAGNEVRATLAGTEIDRIVGIAPRARIAVYKACWLEPGQERGSCSTADLQRAIEDAVADGVDIINYSVGNTDISISDPDDLALLAASNAGILSVVAAGNDGPDNGTILSPSGAPWVLTVGASSRTGDRFDAALRIDAPDDLASNVAMKEASFTPRLRDEEPITANLVLASDGDITGGTDYDACSALINGSDITGKIAFLQRGACDFEIKLRNAETAGAIAVVVFSNNGEHIIMTGPRGSVDIPAVMINQGDGQRLLSSLQNGEAVKVTLDSSLILTAPETGNILAGFSSRGPNLTAPNILKPDVTAPGVNILAGQTPDVANGVRDELFQYLSGTSMSTPHVAGIAALIKEAHPDWSPAAIKSSLITTGRQDIVKEDGQTPADPFDIGGGHVVPNLAVEPGLIYEAGKNDYEAFLCGLNNGTEGVIDNLACEKIVQAGVPTDASALNLPSIAVSALVSDTTIRRRVTNVGSATQYTVKVDAPPGIDVAVNPSVLSLGTGETGVYDVTLTKVSAALHEWQFGSLSWSDNEHSVRTPIAVRPEPFIAPRVTLGSGASGNLRFEVQFGYTGTYTTAVAGLAAPHIVQGTVVTDGEQNSYIQIPIGGNLPADIWRSPPNMIVTDATDTYLRVALFDANTTGDDDLDLYVYYCPTAFSCEAPLYSGNFNSNEQVDILLPDAGNYIVDVHGFHTEGDSSNFDLFVWTVGAANQLGNLAIAAPTAATSGTQGTVTVTWDGLDTHRDDIELKAHLGTIIHDDQNPDAQVPLQLTVIEIQH